MDEYLTIELTEWGFTFSTAHLDIYISWLGLGFIVAGLITYKLIKRFKRSSR